MNYYIAAAGQNFRPKLSDIARGDENSWFANSPINTQVGASGYCYFYSEELHRVEDWINNYQIPIFKTKDGVWLPDFQNIF